MAASSKGMLALTVLASTLGLVVFLPSRRMSPFVEDGKTTNKLSIARADCDRMTTGTCAVFCWWWRGPTTCIATAGGINKGWKCQCDEGYCASADKGTCVLPTTPTMTTTPGPSYKVGGEVQVRDSANNTWVSGTLRNLTTAAVQPDGWPHSYPFANYRHAPQRYKVDDKVQAEMVPGMWLDAIVKTVSPLTVQPEGWPNADVFPVRPLNWKEVEQKHQIDLEHAAEEFRALADQAEQNEKAALKIVQDAEKAAKSSWTALRAKMKLKSEALAAMDTANETDQDNQEQLTAANAQLDSSNAKLTTAMEGTAHAQEVLAADEKKDAAALNVSTEASQTLFSKGQECASCQHKLAQAKNSVNESKTSIASALKDGDKVLADALGIALNISERTEAQYKKMCNELDDQQKALNKSFVSKSSAKAAVDKVVSDDEGAVTMAKNIEAIFQAIDDDAKKAVLTAQAAKNASSKKLHAAVAADKAANEAVANANGAFAQASAHFNQTHTKAVESGLAARTAEGKAKESAASAKAHVPLSWAPTIEAGFLLEERQSTLAVWPLAMLAVALVMITTGVVLFKRGNSEHTQDSYALLA